MATTSSKKGAKNPHKSHTTLTAARIKKATRIEAKGKNFVRAGLKRRDMSTVQKGLRMQVRGYKSGKGGAFGVTGGTHTEGPVGRLPNPLSRKEWEHLVRIYGTDKAYRALQYWNEHSVSFRKWVKGFQFLKDNEYLWNTPYYDQPIKKKRNPLVLFDDNAKATARRVTRIRPVRHKITGEPGEIVASLSNGYAKVKWDRGSSSIIKRSELKLRRGLKANPKGRRKIGKECPRCGGHRTKLYSGKDLYCEDCGQTTWTKPKKKNPSVTAIAQKFQGKANGSVEQLHAASSAPSNLARAGRLIFLKVSGRILRVPGAMVAIAPNERLWIVGDHAPLFASKAKRGQGLDVGEISHICYETAKRHVGNGKTFEYVHEFGEDGGKRPHLIIDHEGMPLIRGGDYKIKAEGIVN